MVRIAIIVGSTRPGRKAEEVARWVHGFARARTDAQFEVVDVQHFGLPLLDAPLPPSMGRYRQPPTKRWAEPIAGFDGFLFVTPEYNHGMPAGLKNAIDYLYAEWNNKAAAFVSYGSAGGVRAVEQFRQVMAELQVADVRQSVFLSLREDFENYSVFRPRPIYEDSMRMLLEQLVRWSVALKGVREAPKDSPPERRAVAAAAT